MFAIVVGTVYLVVACWDFAALGFGLGHHIFGLMDVRLANNIFHAVIGVASVAVGFTSTPRHLSPPTHR